MHTVNYEVRPTGAGLILLEHGGVRVFDLNKRAEWKFGRHDPTGHTMSHVSCESRLVSREHGAFLNVDGQWYFIDNPRNMNGTFHNGVKIPRPMSGRMRPVLLEDGDVLRVDNADLRHSNPEGVIIVFTNVPTKGHWTVLPLRSDEVTIGRGERCTLVEPMAYVSELHVKLNRVNGDYYLTDCNSHAGTYLNGKQVRGPVRLKDKDVISICDCRYFYLGDRLLYVKHTPKRAESYVRSSEQPVVLRADIATKMVKNNSGNGMKELIRDVHLEIRQNSLVAVLGTAGAGKSTVMNCLNGMDLEGVRGRVMYRGVDLMKEFSRMKYLIGSVPQTKTFHEDFTPEQEFTLAARKRLPSDTSKKEIESRVDRTLKTLGIDGVRKSRISKLSGGERTRVNIGIELVADRELLCMDEPDQGLDPRNKRNVFELLRRLAHEDEKVVLSIIHDVSYIDLFDQVILLTKYEGVGRVAFSGTPNEMRKTFGVEDLREVYGIVEANPEKYVK